MSPDHPHLPAEFAQPAEKYAETGRLRLHYLEWGTGPRTVVCIPGTSMSAHAWSRLATDLCADYRVIGLNQRGHGRSDKPATGYSIRDYCDDLADFFRVLGLKQAALVGSSLGTQTSIAFAAAYPDAVNGLVLSDPSCTIEQPAIDGYVRSHNTRPRDFSSFDDAYRFVTALPQRAGLESEAMQQMAAAGDFFQRTDGRWEWNYYLPGILETFSKLKVDQWPEVRAVRAPVLILHAETSHVLSGDNARKLAATFPKARLVDLKGSSHTIWGDRPAEMTRLTREHLATLQWSG